MQGFLIPLVCGIAEHQTLITCADICISLVGVDSSENIGILGLDVSDYLAVCSIKTDCFTCIADLSANVACNLLKVDLVRGHSGFSEKNDLQAKWKN